VPTVGVWWPISRHGVTWDDVRRASAYAELDSKRKETNDLYWFGPSCQAIPFTSSRRVAFCVGLIGMIVRVIRGCTVPLFI
jgi:hypothetical protein